MKILIVGNYPFEYNPSMHAYAQLLSSGLSAAGLETRVIRPYPILGRILKKGLAGKWLGYIDRFVIFPFFLIVSARNYDIIHVADHCNSIYIPYIASLPHLITCHDMIGIQAGSGLISSVKLSLTGRFLQRMILRGLRLAKNIVCVSEQTERELLSFIAATNRNIVVIPNSLRFDFQNAFRYNLSQSFLCNVSNLSPYIIHVGSNMPQKNRPAILEIFRVLVTRKKFSNFNLIIAGQNLTPESHEWLRSNDISSRVFEFGFVSNEELACLYSKAEFLIFPSLREGFGWPIIEAQSSGCLVVTSDKPPMNEVAGRGAILVDPNNVASAVEEIVRMFPERDAFVSFGYENCRKYQAKNMVDSLVILYKHILENR